MPTNQQPDTIMEMIMDSNDKLTDKQKQIISAAIDTFSEKGYSGSSTSEIAKKAGVAEGTIFRHYKTKKDLLVSIVLPVMSRIVAPLLVRDMNKILEEDYETFEDFLRSLLDNRVLFVQKNLPIIRIMLQEIPFHPDLQEQFKKHVASKIMIRVIQVIDHFKAKGDIVDWPSTIIFRLMLSSGISYIVSRYLLFPDKDWNEQEEIDKTVAFVSKGFKK